MLNPVTVIELVARERARLSRVLSVWGGALVLAATAAVLAVAAVVLGGGRWMALPAVFPFVAWALAAAAAVGLVLFTIRHVRADASTARVAAAIEQERRLRLGALRGALEVGHLGALGRRGARELVARLQASVPRQAALAPRLRQTAGYRALAGLGIAVLALGSLGAAAVGVPDGWGAVIHPIEAWRGTLLSAIRVAAPRDVPRGHEAHVHVMAEGRQRLRVSTRATGAPWASAWYPVVRGRVDLTTGPISAELAVVATDGRATSDTVVVRASDRPFVGGLAMRAVYPSYLHRAEEPLAAGEVARVPRGTRIEITGEASATLASIALVRGRDSVALQPTGRRFAGRLFAELPGGQWSWQATAASGAITDVPPPLGVDVIPDSAPHVEIVSPSHDTTITVGDRISVAIAASDDHALALVQLRTWRTPAVGDPLPAIVQPVSDSAVPQWSGSVELDLAARGLQPGDALRLVAEATDGSPWHQTSVSQERVLRVPSLTEQRMLVRAAADSAVSTAAATAAAQRQLQQQTEEAARARGARSGGANGTSTSSSARSTMSYESAERAKALANQQRELANRVQQLQRQTQQLERQLKQAGALDSALSAELRQAQQLLNDALTPEMRDQLAKLDQNADSLRGGDTHQSLEQLTRQQQQMRAQLERSLDILKRAALEGAMQTLHDEARDIAKEERSRSGTPPTSPQTAAAQARADSAALAKARSDSAHAAATAARKGDLPLSQSEPQLANNRPAQPASPRQDATRQPETAKLQSGTPPSAGQRPSDEQLTERSRALSKDVEQLAQRLAEQQAQTGAQQVSAARDHVDSSAQAMSQRQTANAASQMDRAAQQLGNARQQQIQDWKNALTQQLDRSIQETMQLARQESQLAQQAQQAQQADEKKAVQAGQSAVQQGAERAGQQLQKASRQSAMVSGNSQRALGQAQTKVQNATKQAEQQMASGATASQSGSSSGDQSGNSGQTAAAMRAAADALNQAAAAMMQDRERAASATSASGLAEMLQEMQQMAKAQASINAQAQGLSLNPGSQSPGGGPNPSARAVAEGQRKLAESLDRLGDDDVSGRAQGLASEAHQIADALARSGVEPQTLVRQQRLYHRLLDAGHTLEQDERDSTGKRVAEAATGREQFTPGDAPVDGRSAVRFREPSWAELRGLSADERQMVLEYFKRINAQSP